MQLLKSVLHNTIKKVVRELFGHKMSKKEKNDRIVNLIKYEHTFFNFTTNRIKLYFPFKMTKRVTRIDSLSLFKFYNCITFSVREPT